MSENGNCDENQMFVVTTSKPISEFKAAMGDSAVGEVVSDKSHKSDFRALRSLFVPFGKIVKGLPNNGPGYLLKGKGVALDAWGMVCLLEKQTFVKVSKPVFSRMYEMRLVNKKRTKRFVKQNVNRFLYSAEKRQRELDDRYDNYYSTMDYYNEAFTDDAIPTLK